MDISIPVPITCRQHFFLDPVFSDCWKLVDTQKIFPFVEQVKIVEEEEVNLSTAPITLSWKWNNMAKIAERLHFSRLIPNVQISSDVEICPHSYKILLDVHDFLPHELAIFLTERIICVKGKHEEREDSHGPVKREFKRKYVIPSDVIMEKIQCSLSCDGIMRIVAPRDSEGVEENEYVLNHPIIELKGQGQEQCQPLPNIVEYLLMMADSENEASGLKIPLSEIVEPSLFEIFIEKMIPMWNKGVEHPDKKFGNKSDKLMFKIILDVGPYGKDDLLVHAIGDQVVVEGSHEEKQDEYGSIERTFTRAFDLPRNVNVEDLKCEIIPEGILEISAPRSQSQFFNSIESAVKAPKSLAIVVNGISILVE